MTGLSQPAAIIAGIESMSLVDEMAEALRDCARIDIPVCRGEAYRRAGIAHYRHPLSEALAADEQACSIELARRMGGARE